MKNFLSLYLAGGVKRWHTKDTIKEQTLASHQWGVALICMQIKPGDVQLLEAALCHDLGEVVTGDIPYPKEPEMRRLTETAEARFARDNNLPIVFLLDEEQSACLRWADMFEALMFAQRETELGNTYMLKVVHAAVKALDDMGTPNKRAAELIDQLIMEN